jgi:membrane-associated phospholipid phosphatase
MALAAGRWRQRLGLKPPLATAIAATGPLWVAASLEPGRVRRAATWAAHMGAYKIAFEAPIDRRAALRERLRIDYPIGFDSTLGGGKPLPQRLQERLRHPRRISLLDKAISILYSFWEIEPHLAMLWFLLRRPDAYPRAAGRLAATFDLTLVGYWFLPTAPPWWASENLGRMDGSVRRVVIETERELRGQQRPAQDHEIGANPWAAMPSDHLATALMTGLLLYEADRRIGFAALGYAGLLGFALVYLGEHYVLDLIAGAALALLVRRLEPLAGNPVARVAAAWPYPG